MSDESFIKTSLIRYFQANKATYMNFDYRNIRSKIKRFTSVEYSSLELNLSNDSVFSPCHVSATKLVIDEPYTQAFWTDGSGGQQIHGLFTLKNSDDSKVYEKVFDTEHELELILMLVFPNTISMDDKNTFESIQRRIKNFTEENIDDFKCDLQGNIRIIWKIIKKENPDHIDKFKSLIIDYLHSSCINVYQKIIGSMLEIVKDATEPQNKIPEDQRVVPIFKSELESILGRLNEIVENTVDKSERGILNEIRGELQELYKIAD